MPCLCLSGETASVLKSMLRSMHHSVYLEEDRTYNVSLPLHMRDPLLYEAAKDCFVECCVSSC